MKTPEFIKMLQEADPEGKYHIRLPGGSPDHVVIKEGYYDGPYSYVDTNGNFVITDKEMKVDVHCIDLEDFVWDIGTKEVIIDLRNKDRKKEILTQVEKLRKERDACNRGHLHEHTFQVLGKVKEGWKIIQPKHKPIGHYNVMWFVKDPSKFSEFERDGIVRLNNENQEVMCQGDCGAVLKSGFFKHEERDTVIEWTLII